MNKKLATNKGITLLALIITMIVLIILAGVVLRVIMTDDGTIKKTEEAAQKAKIEELRKTIESEILGKHMLGEEKPTLEELKEKGIIDDIEDGRGIVEKDGYVFVVEETTEGYIVKLPEEGGIIIVTHTLSTEKVVGSVDIILNATQSKTGIKEIRKPDKSVEQGNGQKNMQIQYSVASNGKYIFKIIDMDGNTKTYIVKITNIGDITHTLTPPSWTPTDVLITVRAGIKDVIGIQKPNGEFESGKTSKYTVDENGEYTFIIKKDENVENNINYKVTVDNIDRIAPVVLSAKATPETWTQSPVTITLEAADYGSGIASIIKPDGSIVSASSVQYIATANGNYTFKIRDKAGNETTRTIIVNNIDLVNPTVTSSRTPGAGIWAYPSVTITVNAADYESGIAYIIRPDGSKVAATSTSYVVEWNGNYNFHAVDNAGRTTIHTVTVDNIDWADPTVTSSRSPGAGIWAYPSVTITVNAADYESGIAYIIRPDGSKVTATSTSYVAEWNGNYNFHVVDNAGRTTIHTVTVDNIDWADPTMTSWTNPNMTTWGKATTIYVNAEDIGSGISHIIKPDGSTIAATSASYIATENGNYNFYAVDYAGRWIVHSVYVSNIDRIPPEPINDFRIYENSYPYITMLGSAVDYQSGLYKYQYRVNNGPWQDSNVIYVWYATNTIQMRALDNVENERLSGIITVGEVNETNGSSVGFVPRWLNGWGGNGSTTTSVTVYLAAGNYKLTFTGINFHIRPHTALVFNGPFHGRVEAALSGHNHNESIDIYNVTIPYAGDWTLWMVGPEGDKGGDSIYGPYVSAIRIEPGTW